MELSIFSVLSTINDGISILSFIISFMIMFVIYCFFHNSSPEKECILLYLYKDFVIMLMSLRSMWFLKVMFTDDESGMNQYLALLICFWLYSLTFTLLILISIISAIKFYMIKTMLLDPPMPWGTNEKFGMMCIRISVGVIAVVYPLVLFATGLYPKIYYLFIKEDIISIDTTLIMGLYLGPLAVLILSFSISSIGSRICKKTVEPQIDRVIPKQMTYFSWLCVVVFGHLICIVILEEVGIPSVIIWKLVQLLISIVQLSVPFAVVMNVESLKLYSKNFVKNRLDDAFFLNIYIVPSCLCLAMSIILHYVYEIIGI